MLWSWNQFQWIHVYHTFSVLLHWQWGNRMTAIVPLKLTLQNIGNIDCFQNKTKHDKHEHCKCNFWYVQWAFNLGLAHGKLPSWYRCKHMRNMLCTHNETYHIIDMRVDPRGCFSTTKDAPKVSQNLKALRLVFGVTNPYQIGVPLQVLNERIH